MNTGKSWVEKVNTEIHYNVAAAMDCIEVGLEVPDVKFLRNLKEDEKKQFLNDPEWEQIGDTGMIMKRVEGPEVVFHAHCIGGKELSCRSVSINATRLLTGDQGPELGENCQTIFSGSAPMIEPIIDKLVEMANRYEALDGFINLGVIFNDGKPYYRSISYGTTYKFVLGLLELHGAGLESFFLPTNKERRNQEVEGYVASLRVWAYPEFLKWKNELQANPERLSYPYSIEQNNALNTRDLGLFNDQESFYALGKGDKIITAWRDLYSKLPKNGEGGLCFRADGDVKARRMMHELMRGKYLKKVEKMEAMVPA